MADEARQIGIFGGSFNPIHCGHISLAHHLLSALHLDEIWFVVSPLNPFKVRSASLLDDNLRLRLTTLALANEPHLKASDCEFHLPRPSYMWNTLTHLSSLHPDAHFTLLIGADNWLAFDRWAHSADILAAYRVAVYPRPGYPVDTTILPSSVVFIDSPLYPISSTLVRQRVAEGAPITGLVPQSIEEWVRAWYSKDSED